MKVKNTNQFQNRNSVDLLFHDSFIYQSVKEGKLINKEVKEEVLIE